MKISLYILTILLCLSCSKQNKLEEISIQLDKETLNTVRNPGEKGTLRVIGHYSNGKTSDLSLSDLALSVRTVSASGNVEVVALSGDQLIPKDGGLAEVTAVYQKDGATYRAKKRVVVAPYYRDYHQTLVLKLFMGYDGELNEPDPNNVIFQHEDPSRLCTFGQALDVVKRVDNLTRGIPKIIYLVGWQRGARPPVSRLEHRQSQVEAGRRCHRPRKPPLADPRSPCLQHDRQPAHQHGRCFRGKPPVGYLHQKRYYRP